MNHKLKFLQCLAVVSLCIEWGLGGFNKKCQCFFFTLKLSATHHQRGEALQTFTPSLMVDWWCLLLSVILVLGSLECYLLSWPIFSLSRLCVLGTQGWCFLIFLPFLLWKPNSALCLWLVLGGRGNPDNHLLYTWPTEGGFLQFLTLPPSFVISTGGGLWKNLISKCQFSFYLNLLPITHCPASPHLANE